MAPLQTLPDEFLLQLTPEGRHDFGQKVVCCQLSMMKDSIVGHTATVAESDGNPLRYDEETGLAVSFSAVAMVFLTIFLDTLAATISTPALPYYAREFGADDAHIGYLFAAWSFTSTFCAPLLGVVSDRIGRRKVLIWSLVGAGAANLGQATAPSYWILLVWRAFSGIWAAVGSTAQVYLADVCSPAVLTVYMSRLSSVPGAAMTFGPGLGGGLTRFGLNTPILVDGSLSLAAAVLVYVYLPESPSWRSSKAEGSAAKAVPATVPPTPVPARVNLLGLCGFLYGIAFGTRVSMMVIALNAKLGLDAVQVGYVYVAFALSMLSLNIWVTPTLQHRLGLWTVAVAGIVVQSSFWILGFVVMSSTWPCLVCLMMANCGGSLRMACDGPISAQFADSTNRGAVFARVQMMTNFGRMIGPLVAGHLAVRDPVTLPWIFAASSACLSAVLLLMVHPPREAAPSRPRDLSLVTPLTAFSDLVDSSASLEDEVGGPADYERVGRFIGDLLTQRHYRWVSKQDSVLRMLEKLIPELRVKGDEHLQDLVLLQQHATQMQRDFCRLEDQTL